MASSDHYHSFFNYNPLPSWIYDLNTFQVLDVNQTAIQHYGYSRDEFLSLTIKDIRPKDTIPKMLTAHENIEQLEGTINFGVFTHQKKDGERIRMEISGHKLEYDGRKCMLVICQDVTQRERQIELLQEKSKQLNAISSIGKIGYWRLELDGRALSWTDEVFNIWGRKREDFKLDFEHFAKTIHPDDFDTFMLEQDAAFAGSKMLDCTHRIILPDQSIKWVRERGRLLYNGQEQPCAFEGTVEDISERKEAELRMNQLHHELSKSEERFRVAQELSPDGFTILHPVRNDEGEVVDFTWVFENQAVAHINGTDPNDVIGKNILDVFPSHRGTDIFEAYINVATTGIATTIEEVYVGEILAVPTWMRLVIVSMGDDIAIHAQNITERKLGVETIRKSEANFRSIFEIASLGIAQVDPSNGRILLINGYYATITGYQADELLNMSFLELTHPDDIDHDWELFSKAARGEGEYRNEKRYIKKDGTVIWVRIHLAFIRDVNGKATRTVAICEDITQRKEAELRLHNLSDHLPGVVFQYLLYPDGTDALRSVSKGAHHVWGYSPEMVENDINLVWNQTKAGGDFEQVRQSVLEAATTKTNWQSRYRSVQPSGVVQIHLGSGTPNYLADGTVLFNSLVLDVTKQVNNEKLLSQATQMARIGSWEVNLVNKSIVWSDMVHQLHETDPSSFEPDMDTVIEFFREEFHDAVRSCFQECIDTGKPFDIEAMLISAKNNERWVRIIGQAEMVGGQCTRIFGSFQDIHAQKTNEIALEQSLKKLQDYQYAIDQSASFTITDAEGVIVDVNDHFCALSQYSRDELIGNTHQIINSNYHPKEFFAHFWNTIKSGTIWRGEVRNRKKDGSYYWADTTVVPFVDQHQKPFQYLAFRIDITDRKMAEAKLIELNDSLERYTKELERSNEELEQFAYVSSHDLQEPLRMITSFMDQLVRKYGDHLDDRALQYIHFATDGAKRMKQVILDLLLYSQANKTVDQAEKVDLNEIVAEYNLLRRKLIAEKNATITIGHLPTLDTYKAPITQIFHCLLDNALKYVKVAEPSCIHITCTERKTEWEFAINDNGIGIEEEFFDKIFIIFQRLHNRDHHEGTGVGLSIAKRSVEFLGGRIWVESQIDVGSTFFFTIAKNERPYHG